MEPSANIFRYFPERQRLGSPASTWVAILLPTIATLLVGMAAGIMWGAMAGFALAAYLWVEHRRTKPQAQATFRIDDQRLVVTNAAGWDVLDASLEELEEVVLDTKTIQKFHEDTSGGFFDARAIHVRMEAPIDNARIELVTVREVIPLTDHHTSSIDATDWLVRIRRFLRAHGWQPRGEREEST
jgi:hypothetical protein